VRWRFLALLAVLVAAGPADHELRAAALTLAEGARGAVSLTIAPAAGKSIDAAAPLSLHLSVPDGLTVGKKRLALADAADPRAEAPRFELAVTAARAGRYTLRVEARFWLCGKKVCRPVRDAIDVPVTVEPASASPR
jgi:hypothetical protein